MSKNNKKLEKLEESIPRPAAFTLLPEDYHDPQKIRDAQFLEYQFKDLVSMLDKYNSLKKERYVYERHSQLQWKPKVLRKWPYLNLLQPSKCPKVESDGYYSIRKNVSDAKDGNTEIDFVNMRQQWKGNMISLSDIIVYVRPLGIYSGHWFYIPKDSRIDAFIVAGHDNNETLRAFLMLDWYERREYALELEFFSLLSLIEKTNDSEVGIMTIYNKGDGAVHTKVIEGYPNLNYAYEFSVRPDDYKYENPTPADDETLEENHDFITVEDAKLKLCGNIFDRLTEREREVVIEMLKGLPGSRIATELNIKPNTVYVLQNNIYRKLQINTKVELFRLAAQTGFHNEQGSDGHSSIPNADSTGV